MTKYQNTNAWLAPVRLYDEQLAEAVHRIHTAICLADDIADRDISPKEVVACLWSALVGVGMFTEFPEKWAPVKSALSRIQMAEIENQNFVPGKKQIEEEVKSWEMRGNLLDLYFSAWCIADPTFQTDENWKWFEEFKRYCLILDDCEDILGGVFEDLNQCRRNYVVLTMFGHDGYVGWKERREEFQKAAQEIKDAMGISMPKDERMKAFLRG